MIKEIYSFDSFQQFISNISNDSNFADPHFEFDHNNLYDSLKKDNRKAFIVTESGQIKGLFVWLIIHNEKYIEMLIGLSKDESIINEMISYLENKYGGYKFDFVINPKHYLFFNVLKSRKAFFENEQQWMICNKDVKDIYHFEIVPLSYKYETQYIDKHRKDTYWTAKKVIEAKDKFRTLLAINEGKVIGYIDVTYCYEKNEPYDIWVDAKYQNKGYEQALLQVAIKMNKPNKMMILVDVTNHKEIEVLESIGFVPLAGVNSIYASYKSKKFKD